MSKRFAMLCMLTLLLFPACKMARLVSLYKSTRQHVEPQQVTAMIEIPFSYYQDWIVLHVLITQGATHIAGDFLFDSGAFTRLFDSCPAINIRRPENVSRMPVTGALGTSWKELKIAKGISLKAGSFTVFKPNLFASDRPAFFPGHWLGIIGADFFHNHALTIDFEHRRLLVHSAASFQASSLPHMRLKMIANHNPVLRDVQLGDMAQRDYLIDIGNNGSVLIQQPGEAALRKAMGAGIRAYAFKQRESQDGSGKIVASGYYVKAAKTINAMPCPEYEVAGLVNNVRYNKYGNIGLAFLNQVFESCTIDFKRRLFYYKINARPGSSERFDRAVYFRQEDGSFFTGPVLISSTWYEQGLRPEMQVIDINGENPSVYLGDRKEGKAVDVKSIRIKIGDTVKMITKNN